MAITIPTDQEIIELMAGALYSAIESVGELDEPREAAEWEIKQALEKFTPDVDQDLDPEDQLEELRYEIQSVLEDIHSAVQGMENGYDFHVELIYTSEIEEYYEENMFDCDEYFGECKEFSDNMDELKSYMVHMALSTQASSDVYDLAEAIEAIDPEDII